MIHTHDVPRRRRRQPSAELTTKIRHNLLRGLVVSGCITRFYAFGDDGVQDQDQDLDRVGSGGGGFGVTEQVTQEVRGGRCGRQGCEFCVLPHAVSLLGGRQHVGRAVWQEAGTKVDRRYSRNVQQGFVSFREMFFSMCRFFPHQ